MHVGLLKEVLSEAIGETWQISKKKIIKAARVCRKTEIQILNMIWKYK